MKRKIRCAAAVVLSVYMLATVFPAAVFASQEKTGGEGANSVSHAAQTAADENAAAQGQKPETPPEEIPEEPLGENDAQAPRRQPSQQPGSQAATLPEAEPEAQQPVPDGPESPSSAPFAALLQGVEPKSTPINFPDGKFLACVREITGIYGRAIYPEDVAGITGLYVYRKGISSLEGIEYFTGLTTLSCWENNLTTLDVSALSNLTGLYCGDNKITSLTLGACNLVTLDAYNNQLTSLDVSGCSNLSSLVVWQNQLTSLDVSACNKLTTLSFSQNTITSLTLGSQPLLTSLDCRNNMLNSLDLSGLGPKLMVLRCNGNQLTLLDVSSLKELIHLECGDNRITALNLKDTPKLLQLNCSGNLLSSLVLDESPGLANLNCTQNNLTGEDKLIGLNAQPARYSFWPQNKRVLAASAVLSTGGATVTVETAYAPAGIRVAAFKNGTEIGIENSTDENGQAFIKLPGNYTDTSILYTLQVWENDAGADGSWGTPMEVSIIPQSSPQISGPANITLTEGYTAMESNRFTVEGTLPVTAAVTSGPSAVIWNNANQTLHIAAGLAAGEYPVTLTATDGRGTQLAHSFTLTVLPKLSFTGPSGIRLAEGYEDTESDSFTLSGISPVTVSVTSGPSGVTWNSTNKTLEIAAGLAAGEYPVVLTVADGGGAQLTYNFTLAIFPRLSVTGPTSLNLTEGYEDTESDSFTLTGAPSATVTVSITSGSFAATRNSVKSAPGAVTWNNERQTLCIAAGLAAGEYQVTLTVRDGVSADSTFQFRLHVAAGGNTANVAVIYDAGDDDGNMEECVVVLGDSHTILNCMFTKTAYRFKEWNTQADGNGTAYAPGDVLANVQSTVVLYARWEKDSAQWRTITFASADSAGGTLSGTLMYDGAIGSGTTEVQYPTPVAASGYQFNGWSISIPSTFSHENIIIYANWAATSTDNGGGSPAGGAATGTPAGTPPKTGDASALALWLALAALSASGLAGTAFWRRKNRKINSRSQ